MRRWHCSRLEIPLDRPVVMGIVNVTPDSFSDGGLHNAPADAVAYGLRLFGQGADLLDVGGESTRPGARGISSSEELARVRPVVTRLAAGNIPVSIDTRHADVARACVESGAMVINDVGGFRDPAMIEVAAACDAGLVVMHMLGEPGTMQKAPRYGDVVADVRDWLLDRALALQDAGVARERIALDPGIGFGKTLDHNLELLRALHGLAAYGYPVVVGASRKRFIGEITGVEEPRERLGGSLAAAVWAVTHGADIVRVHDVAESVQAVRVAAKLSVED